MANKAVFLDRDGIINKSIIKNGKPYPPQGIEDFEWTDGIKQALESLKKEGFILIVFTNQPDVSRGTQSVEQVEKFHRYIKSQLPIDKIYACYHENLDNCECRKPKPGMILTGQAEYDIELSQSYAVGDRWRDIDAGNASGCQTIFLDYGYDEELRSQPDFVIKEIKELLSIIVPREREK